MVPLEHGATTGEEHTRNTAPYPRKSCGASLDRWDNVCRGSAA